MTYSVNVALPLKFGKRPSGYAFVGYATADSAKKAVDELNDKSESRVCLIPATMCQPMLISRSVRRPTRPAPACEVEGGDSREEEGGQGATGRRQGYQGSGEEGEDSG